MSYLHYKFGYVESLDYTQLPGYEKLDEQQRQKVHEVFSMAYHESVPLGINLALGKAHEDAKIVLEQILNAKPELHVEEAPRSIFYGIETL